MCGVRRAWESIEIIAGEEQRRVGVAHHRIERPGFVDVDPELGRIGHIVIMIAVGLLAGWQQLQRRDRNIGGTKMRDVERIVEIVLRTAQADGFVESAE